MRHEPRTVLIAVMLVMVGAIDIVGTPLSIVALKHAQRNLDRATTVTIQARRDDCEAAERLRRAVRARLVRERQRLPLTLRLIPSLNTPQIKKLTVAKFARELRENAAVDCAAYANRAQP